MHCVGLTIGGILHRIGSAVERGLFRFVGRVGCLPFESVGLAFTGAINRISPIVSGVLGWPAAGHE